MSTATANKKPATPPLVAPKQAEQVQKLQAQESREAAQVKKAQTKKPTKFLIIAPLAEAKRKEPIKYNHVGTKIPLQIHEGWAGTDEHGNPRWREGGVVHLYDGEGFTDNELWANYLQEQWPDLVIRKSGTRTPSSDELAQRLEIENLKAEFEEEGEYE